MHITIVTWNTGKYRQISWLLHDFFPCVQQNIDLLEPQSNDMVAVSSTKARQVFEMVQWPVLVDDSGIYFSAYPDFPGVFSKYMFQSLGVEWLRRLFLQQPNTDAYFQCVLSYMDATLPSPVQFVGRVEGVIDFRFLESIVIDKHLPYDAIFRADGMDVVAQLDMSTFESLHHRAKATTSARQWLAERYKAW